MDGVLQFEARKRQAQETRDQEHRQEHQQAAQGEQDELLDDQPAAIALLRLEQEFHGRPADAPEAHAVDQVDDDRQADQGGAGRQVSRIQELGEHASSLTE